MYRFKAQVKAPKGLLDREERSEIRDYVEETALEAAGEEKALRLLAKKLSARVLKLDGAKAELSLPDYGAGCKLLVETYEEK